MTVVAITHKVYAGDTTDKYGAPAVPTSTVETVLDALVAPVVSADLADPARDGRRVEFDLYLPFAVDIGPHDTVTIDGVAYEVEGQANPWEAAWSGWQAGRTVRVWRTVG